MICRPCFKTPNSRGPGSATRLRSEGTRTGRPAQERPTWRKLSLTRSGTLMGCSKENDILLKRSWTTVRFQGCDVRYAVWHHSLPLNWSKFWSKFMVYCWPPLSQDKMFPNMPGIQIDHLRGDKSTKDNSSMRLVKPISLRLVIFSSNVLITSQMFPSSILPGGCESNWLKWLGSMLVIHGSLDNRRQIYVASTWCRV